jgi:SAM-dependent methyltransferase
MADDGTTPLVGGRSAGGPFAVILTDAADVAREALAFRSTILEAKQQLEHDTFWYPYDTLANFAHLNQLLQSESRRAFEGIRGKRVVDIGCADGDTAFFVESLGAQVDVVDHAPTNFNELRGVARLKGYFGSSVSIHDIDLDSQFALPRPRYDLAFFLGILYHLKNPYFILEALARSVDKCFLSTKVARFAGPTRIHIESLPVAYLLDTREANNDPTNFWVFTNSGLQRLLERTGWEILDYTTFGNTDASDPATAAGDERAFCYLRSRRRAT